MMYHDDKVWVELVFEVSGLAASKNMILELISLIRTTLNGEKRRDR